LPWCWVERVNMTVNDVPELMKRIRSEELKASAMMNARLRWRMWRPVSVCARDAYP
jgi:hypothetical protein